MPIFNLNDLLKIAAKAFLLSSLLVLVHFFVNYLVGLLPPLHITGCAGYYFERLGISYGLRLMLSIVLYGFVGKFTLSFVSRVLD